MTAHAPTLTIEDVRKYVGPHLLAQFLDPHVQRAIEIATDMARAYGVNLSTLSGIHIACENVRIILERTLLPLREPMRSRF